MIFDAKKILLLGVSPQSTQLVTELLQEKALVTILAPQLPTTLADLVIRGLITQLWPEDKIDFNDYDLVIPEKSQIARNLESSIDNLTNPKSQNTPQKVTLLGGGLGDPRLITLAGLEALAKADIIIYDRLAPLSCLAKAKTDAELIDVGKIPRGAHTSQEAINSLLIEKAATGKKVVRFKGGDNFIFGRGGEEALALAEAGYQIEIIPGVTSAIAAPGLAGIPVTHRGLTQGLTIISGHIPPNHPESTLDWQALARSNTTLVILMGVKNLPEITKTLIAAELNPETPAATIADAGLPSMQIIRSTLDEIANAVHEAKIRPPAITVIGEVAALDLLSNPHSA